MTSNFGGPGYNRPGYNEQRAYMRSVITRAKFIRAGVFAGAALVAVAFGWGAKLLNGTGSESQADKKRDQEFVRLEPTEKYDALNSMGPSSGPLVYTAFERKGRFIPATEAQAAQNVPYPIQQPGMDNYDRAGLYAFLAYYFASMNYFYHTGDTEPLSKVTDPEKVLHPEILRLYREKRGWVISADKNVLSANVVDDLIAGEKPKNTSRNILVSTLYTNKATNLAFYVKETGEKQDIHKYLRYLGRFSLAVEHLRGQWVIVADRDGYSIRNTYEPIYPQGFGQL
ncbi:CTD phosphatase [Rothia sp. HMSC061D12]|nr:CTD phosphatase [Rothia sp. HMSC061D12]